MFDKMVKFLLCSGSLLFLSLNLNANFEIKNFDDVVNLFPKSTNEIEQHIADLKKNVLFQVNEIVKLPYEKYSFETVAQKLDSIFREIEIVREIFGSIIALSPQQKLREEATKNLSHIESIKNELVLGNQNLWNIVCTYVAKKSNQENLSEEHRNFLKFLLHGKESGVCLSERAKEFNALRIKQQNLTTKFQKNLASIDTKLIFSSHDLEGLCDVMLQSFQKNEKGDYLVELNDGVVKKVLLHARKQETRKKVYQAFNNRAYPENYIILEELRKTNDALVKLCGYKNFVEYDLIDQMAQNGETVEKFLCEMIQALEPKQKENIGILLKTVPEAAELMHDGQFYPWDFPYLIECYKKIVLNIDESQIAEYFPLDHVVREALFLYGKFLGVQFKEIQCKELWDDKVRSFAVYDTVTGSLRGYLILDLYARAQKAQWIGCTFGVIYTNCLHGKISPGVFLLVTNFSSQESQRHVLLTYHDVQVILHELGHTVKGLLNNSSLAIGAVQKIDFVEVASTFFENWMRDKNIVKQFSCHYKTKKQLTDDVIQKLIEAKKFEISDVGEPVIPRIGKSFVALEFYKNSDKSVQQIYEDWMRKVATHLKFDKEDHFPAGWQHVVNSFYLSKYYSYLWSRVLSTDIFSKTKEAGSMNPIMGRRLRDIILSKGSKLADPHQMIVNFLGRKPTQDAYLNKFN